MARGVNTADDPNRRGDWGSHRDREMTALGYQTFHKNQGEMFMRFPNSDPRHPGNPAPSPEGKVAWDMTGYYRGPSGEFTFNEMNPRQFDAKMNIAQRKATPQDIYESKGRNPSGENFWDTRFPNNKER